MSVTELPEAWSDLITGLQLLGQHPTSAHSPLHCEHDVLTVCADSTKFTGEELRRLELLGFHPDREGEGAFYSFRFGSA